MTRARVAIIIYGLSENWLGGVNYFRNLVSVFDDAADSELSMHVLTDDPSFFADLHLSDRVEVHRLAMLKSRTPAWVLRKALLTTLRRDALLIAEMRQLGISAVVFSHVPGATAAGIRCLPWIPDFQSRHHPELFQPAIVEAEHRRTVAWMRDSDGLIVSSQAARDDAVAFYGADPRRLHVLSFAPRLDATVLDDASIRDAVLDRHGLAGPYIFLPNQYWQHKNHGLVLKALLLLKEQGRLLPCVVSTGKTEDMRNPSYFAEFAAQVRSSALQENYRILGVVPRQDMLILLAHSAAVLNPSRFEGWSTSVEEAKALGKTLLVSDIAVHREQVAGLADAAVFGPEDAPALARLMDELQARPGWQRHHPPLPQTEFYETFSRQYIAMLKAQAVSHGGGA